MAFHPVESVLLERGGSLESPIDVVRAFWEKVWTQGQAHVVRDLFSENPTENGEPLDLEAFAGAVQRWTGEIFPDFEARIEELTDLGDGRVLSRVTYKGTHQGSFMKMEASGRVFQTIGIDIFTIENGRITEFWHTTDHLDLVLQIGGKVVPDESLA